MTKINQPAMSTISYLRAKHAHRQWMKSIRASQKKLAETTPVSYTRIYA